MPTAVVKALVVQCKYSEEKRNCIVFTEEVAVKSTNSTAEQVSFQKCYSKISNTGLLLLLFKSLKVS